MAKVVGVVNFSTLCKKNSGSFISSRENDWEEHVSRILKPERLMLRLKLFTELSLPLFDVQELKPKKEWFRLVVIISDLLPAEYKLQLKKAEAIRPWLTIEERSENDWLDAKGAIKRALSDMVRDEEADVVPFASFRLDDDDFISTNFLKEVTEHVTKSNVNSFLTFSNGYKCVWEKEKITNIVPVHMPLIAIGLTHIGLYNKELDCFSTKPETVFAGINHYELDKEHNVIDIETSAGFVWSQHSHQDTAGRFKSSEIKNEWNELGPQIIDYLLTFPPLITRLKL